MEKRVDVRSELEKIRLQQGGMLTEEAVVVAAKAKAHPLHDRFTWDDSEAAKLWRLEEARKLIRSVYVTFEQPPEKPVTVRAYASLPSDREAGLGYRSIQDVMTDEQLRKELLKAAMVDLEIFKRRYSNLSELQPIFQFLEKIKAGSTVVKFRKPKRVA